jgi:hypothetical protein
VESSVILDTFPRAGAPDLDDAEARLVGAEGEEHPARVYFGLLFGGASYELLARRIGL